MEANKRSDVNRIPECGWTKHCCCSEVELEDIGMSHTTVSQQAEQVRVVTGQRAMRMEDRSRREIVLVCRRSKSRTKLRVESERLRSQSRIMITLLPSHDGN